MPPRIWSEIIRRKPELVQQILARRKGGIMSPITIRDDTFGMQQEQQQTAATFSGGGGTTRTPANSRVHYFLPLHKQRPPRFKCRV
jgi:hypothetical protein